MVRRYGAHPKCAVPEILTIPRSDDEFRVAARSKGSRATRPEGERDEEGHLLDGGVARRVHRGSEPGARLVHPRRGAAQVLERPGAGNRYLPVRTADVRAHGRLLANS